MFFIFYPQIFNPFGECRQGKIFAKNRQQGTCLGDYKMTDIIKSLMQKIAGEVYDLPGSVGVDLQKIPPCLSDYYFDIDAGKSGGPGTAEEERKIILVYSLYHRDHLVSLESATEQLKRWGSKHVAPLSPELIASEVERAYSSEQRLSCGLIRSTALNNYCEQALCDYPREGPPVRAWIGGDAVTLEDLCDVSTKQTGEQSIKFSPDKAAAYCMKRFALIATPDDTLWIYQDGIYNPKGATVIDQFLDKTLGDYYNRFSAKELHRKLILRTMKEYSVFDSQPYYFAVENGVIDMSTGAFLPHSPLHYLTSKAPVRYDPTATCPEIEKFLISAFSSSDNVLSFLDIMTAKTTDLLFEFFCVFIGGGANGKSKAEDLIRAFFGDEAIAEVDIATLSQNRFDRKELLKKKFLINSEVSGDQRESRWIKYISGGGRLDADQKGKEHIQFRPRCLIIIDTNDPPRFADRSYGFERRLVKIDFKVRFVEPEEFQGLPGEQIKDPFLLQKITTPGELSGLLNLLIARAPAVLARCKIHRRAGGDKLAEEYEMQSNSIREFIERFTELDSSLWMGRAELYEKYREFCKVINAVPKGKSQFYNYLIKKYKLEESRKHVELKGFVRIFYGIDFNLMAYEEFYQEYDQNITKKLPGKSDAIPLLPSLPSFSNKNKIKDLIDIANSLAIEGIEKFNRKNSTKALDDEKPGNNLVNSGSEGVKRKQPLMCIRLEESVQLFVGVDGNNYGPFRKGDVANLPEIHAINLVNKKLAIIVNCKKQI